MTSWPLVYVQSNGCISAQYVALKSLLCVSSHAKLNPVVSCCHFGFYQCQVGAKTFAQHLLNLNQGVFPQDPLGQSFYFILVEKSQV